MAERIKVAIPFTYNVNWIGGTYYIINLIKALNLLDDSKKPSILIFYEKNEDLNLIISINYPYLKLERFKTWRDTTPLQRAVNKLSRQIIKKNVFEYRPKSKSVDVLFPANNNQYFDLIPDKKKLFWIPDFQEHFLPYFFTKDEVEARKKYQKDLVSRKVNIVFSSYNALSHFNEIYPDNKNNTGVVQFAVSPEKEYEKTDFNELLEKYKLPENYFICSNQFWVHKNHITVLKAIKLLKEDNIKFHVVFTGNTRDYRNPGFYQSLLDFVKEEQLNNHVSFLGFIDRNEQLKLMSKAIAVIQPSLFEGWGTVAEDAKSMNKYIILSDIAVHKEQCTENVSFFGSKNEKGLSEIIEKLNQEPPLVKDNNYIKNQMKFAENFINACQALQY